MSEGIHPHLIKNGGEDALAIFINFMNMRACPFLPPLFSLKEWFRLIWFRSFCKEHLKNF